MPEKKITSFESPPHLREFVNWLVEAQLSKKTVKNYLSDIRRFIAWGEATFQISDALLFPETSPAQYLEYLEEGGTSENTLLRKSVSLRKFQDFLGENKKTYVAWSFPENPTTQRKSDSAREKILQRFVLALQLSGCKESTYTNYAVDTKLFLEFFPTGTLSEICTKPKVAEYLKAQKQNGAASSTLKRKLSSLKTFFRWAAQEEYIDANPYQSISEVVSEKIRGQFIPLAFFEPSAYQPQPATPNLYQKYSQSRLSSYFHLAVLVIFSVAIGVLGYQQFFSQVAQQYAYPSAPTRPDRVLSFQGRLTDSGGTPITTPINFTFRLYNALTGGTELWDSSDLGACSLDPDQDGVFSVRLGDATNGCGNEITDNVFSERAGVWLEVQVSSETLTPRQPLSTVPYSLNSETLQGFPVTLQGNINTIPLINALGEIIIGANNPKIIASSGAFLIQGETLTLQTEAGGAGDITLAPDAGGNVNILSGTTSQDSIFISNANLTTGNLIRGEVGNNNTSYNFLSFAGGSSLDTKFLVDALGNTTIDGYLQAPGATLSATYTGATPLIINGTGGQTLSVNNAGQLALTTQGSTGGITVGGDTNLYRSAADTLRTDDSLVVGTNLTVTNLGTAGGVIYAQNASGLLGVTAAGTSGYCLTSAGSGTPTWADCSSVSGGSFWDQTNGALYPKNSTVDLLVGGNSTASAKFTVTNVNTGVPTATLVGGSGNTFLTAAGNLGTTGSQTLSLGGTTTGNVNVLTTAGAAFTTFDTTNGRVGIGDTTPLSLLTVGSGDLFQVNSAGNIVSIGGVAHSISNSSADLSITASDDLRLIGGNNVYFNDVRTGDIPLTIADTALNPNLTQGIIDAINDIYDTNATSDTFWVQNSGALQTANNTVDVLFGGTSSNSAKFAFLNVNTGTPTASVSAGAAGAAYLTADGTLGTTARQNLKLGVSGTTGDIILTSGLGYRTAVGTSTPESFFEVNGGYGGNALARFVETGSNDILTASAGATTRMTLNNAGQLILPAQGNTGGLLIGTDSNLYRSAADTLRTDDSLVVGTNLTVTSSTTLTALGTAGGIIYAQNSSGLLGVTATGSNGQCLTSNGTSAPSWGSCSGGGGGGDGFWTAAGTVLHPINTSLDLAIGGSSTASAKFQIFGSTGTASTEGQLTFRGPLDPKINILNGENFGIRTSVGGDEGLVERLTVLNGGNVGIGTTAPNDALEILSTTDAQLRLAYDTTNYQAIQVAADGGTTWSAFGTDADLDFSFAGATDGDFSVNTDDLFVDTSTGRVGIGDTTPASLLTVGASDAFQVNSSGNIVAIGGAAHSITNSSGDLIITSTGELYFNDTRTGNIPFSLTDTALNANLSQAIIDAINDTYDLASTDAFWNQTAGALHPRNSTVDLLIGGTSTASADFAFTNVNSGSPTATIAGNLSVIVPEGADPATSYNVLDGGSFNLRTSVGGDIGLTSRLFVENDGDVGIGTTTPSVLLHVRNTAQSSIAESGVRVGVSDATGYINIANGDAADARFGGTITNYITGNNFTSSEYLNMIDGANDTGTDAVANFTSRTTSGAISNRTLFSFNNNTTPVLSILANGNLGLGDASPLSLFTVGSGDLFQINSSGNIVAVGGAAHSIANSSNDLVLTAVDDLVFNDVRTGDIPLTIADTALSTHLTQAIVDAINDIYDITQSRDAFWLQTAGTLQTANNTVDVLFGGTSSNSAKFAFLNVNTGTPTASVSAGAAGAAYLTADGTLGTTARQNLKLGDPSTTGDIILNLATGYRAGIGTTTPLAEAHVEADFSDHAAVIINQLYSGDILAASASGTTRVRISNAGNLIFNQSSSIQTSTGDLTLNPAGELFFDDTRTSAIPFSLTDTNLDSFAVGDRAIVDALNYLFSTADTNNQWILNAIDGTLFPRHTTTDVLFGGTSTATAKLRINQNTGALTSLGTPATAEFGGQVRVGNAAADPTPLGAGSVYFNTGATTLKFYDGAQWQSIEANPGWFLNTVDKVVYPRNITVDALIGGFSTASSKIALNATTGEILITAGGTNKHSISNVSGTLVLDSFGNFTVINEDLHIFGNDIVDDDGQSFISLVEESLSDVFPVKRIGVHGRLEVDDYIYGSRGATLSANAPSDILLRLIGDDNGQTGDYINIDSYSGASAQTNGNIFKIDENGLIGSNTTSPLAQLHLTTFSTSTVGQITQASANQTAALTQWRDHTGTVRSYVDEAGQFRLGVSAADRGILSVNGGNGNASVVINQTDLDQNILTASASGITRASIDRFGDYKMMGPKSQSTIANLTDVYVYDTTGDIDGGQWTNADRAKTSTWFNETPDHTFETCVPGTDDRCGTQYFPKRATITADTTGVRIYDADTQKLWMAFNQGSTALGVDSNNNPKSVQMLNGRLYVGMDGASATGMYIIDFIEDSITRYDTNGRWKYSLPISGRNSSGTYVNLSPVTKLPSNIVNSVSATTITGDNKTLPIDNNYITNGHYTPFNPADSDTARQDISDYAHDYVAVGTDGGALGSVSLIQPDLGNMANIGISMAGIASKNVVLLDDGTLYYTYRDQNSNANDKLKVLREAQKKMSTDPTYRITNTASDSATIIYGNKGNNNFGVAYHDGFDSAMAFNKGPAFPTSTAVINDLVVTKSTSTVDGRGNTIFLGDNADGLIVINEKQGDEVNGSVKYYNKDYITQEIPGFIKGSWAFNNNTASDLEDVSVNANDLTNINSVTFSASGVRGNAATFVRNSRQFLASSSATLIHSNALNAQGDLSVGAWVYVSDTAATSGLQTVLSKWGDTTRRGYKLYLDGGVPIMSVSDNGSDYLSASSSSRLAPNTWHHLMANIIPYKEIQLYIDGNIATKSAGAAIAPFQTQAPFRVGADAQSKHDATNTASNTIGTVQSTTTLYAVPDASAFSVGDYLNIRNTTQSTGTQSVVTYVDTVNDLIQVLASPASTAATDSVRLAKINYLTPASGYFASTTVINGPDSTFFSVGDLVQLYNATDGLTETRAVSTTSESTITLSAAATGAAAGERVFVSKLNVTSTMHGETSDAVDTLTLQNAGGFFKVGESLHVFERISTTVSTWTSINSVTATTIDVVDDVINNVTTDDFTVSKVNKFAPIQGTAASSTVITGPNSTQFAVGDYVHLTRTNGTKAQARATVTAVTTTNITVDAGVSAQTAADTIYVSKLNNETIPEEFFDGRIDDAFVSETLLNPDQIKKMYIRGAGAVNNHTANRVTGVTGADTYQQLHGAGASAATVSRVGAVEFDTANNLLYVGTNDNSANTGGVSVIAYGADSLVDLYDSVNNTTQDDDTGTQFDANDITAISVHGSEVKHLAIVGSNDTTTKLWLQASNVSLRGFMNNNYNPHGETLNQTNLRVEDTLYLGKAGGQQNFFETSGNFTKFYGNLMLNGDTVVNGQLLSDERQFTAKPIVSGGAEGTYTSMELGNDGFARMVFYDASLLTIKYIRCIDINCSNFSFTLIDDGGEGNYDAGQYARLALGPDGLPRITYHDATKGRLFFIRCLDDNCQQRTKTVLSGEGASTGTSSSLDVRSDGTAVVVTEEGSGQISFFDCKNLDCSFVNSNIIDSQTSILYTSVAVNSQDLARVAYNESTGNDLEYVACEDRACKQFTQTTIDATGVTGRYTDIAIGSDDMARVSANDVGSTDLIFVRCLNTACSNRTSVNVDATANTSGLFTSLALTSANIPVITHHDDTANSLRIVVCGDVDCSAGNTATAIDDPTNDVGHYTNVSIASDGTARIAYYDITATAVKYLVCANATCTSASSTRQIYGHIILQEANTVRSVDQVLGFDNLSRIAFYDVTNTDIYYLRCLDVDCNSYNLKLIDENDAGANLSMVLGTDGFPYIAYYDSGNTALRLAKCNDDNCSNPFTKEMYTTIGNSAGTSLTNVGTRNTIRLGRDGLPRIMSVAAPTMSVIFSRCLDVFCHSHNTTDFATTAGSDNTGSADMILDPNDFATIALSVNTDNGATNTISLVHWHCTDIDCNGTDGSSVVGTGSGSVGGGITVFNNIRLNINPHTGLPLITYNNNGGAVSAIINCSNWESCSTIDSGATTIGSGNNYGAEVDKNTGQLLIGVGGTDNIFLVRCSDYLCSAQTTNSGYAISRSTLSTEYTGDMVLRYFGSRTEAVFSVIVNVNSLYYMVASGTNYNIGAPDRPFSNVYANKIQARSTTIDALDLAEEYPTSEPMGAGDIASFDTNRSEHIMKSRVEGDPKLAGVVSTQPGLLLQDSTVKGNVVPLALSGRVPVKIDPLSQPFKIGDFITSSPNKPGYGQKAVKPGYVIGKALEDWQCADPTATPSAATQETCPQTAIVFVGLEYFDPYVKLDDSGEFQVDPFVLQAASQSGEIIATQEGNLHFTLQDMNQNPVTTLGAFGRLFAATIRTGFIRTQELIAQTIQVETSLDTPLLSTNFITPSASGSGDLVIDLTKLANAIDPNSSTSGELANNFGTLLVKGNASISGTLFATNLSAYSARIIQLESQQADILMLQAQDASVSGTLRAGRLEGSVTAEQISNLEGRVADVISRQRASAVSASESGLLAGNSNVQRILDMLNNSPIATASDPWGTVANAPAPTLDPLNLQQFNHDVQINGLLAVESVSIQNTLALGTTMFTSQSLAFSVPTECPAESPLCNTFAIQPSGQGRLSLMADALVISQQGGVEINTNVRVAGNVAVGDSLLTNTLRPNTAQNVEVQLASAATENEASRLGELIIRGQNNQEVAAFSASGSARVRKLIIAAESASQDGETTTSIITNATAGTATLPASASAFTVRNSQVRDTSLLYITPTSNTQNRVLFVQTKTAENPSSPEAEGQFIVAIESPIDQPIHFNWWIIN